MTNQEKKIAQLEKENLNLKEENTKHSSKILELESLVEELSEPKILPIELIFDSMPIKDAQNLLTSLQLKMHNKLTSRIASLRNETGILENNLEIFELNAKNLSLGRVFKTS